MNNPFDPTIWQSLPFHYWSCVLFVFGTMVGSFLNVCIHRLPLGMSIVHPPSHCPACNYQIPWYLNIPLITWLSLRGRCASCGCHIPARYFMVELLTGVAFLACWLSFGYSDPFLAVVWCMVLAAFIAATFIDFEHFIIPDGITLGGLGVGLVVSLLHPALHGVDSPLHGLLWSAVGALTGSGILYAILRGGKMMFGRYEVEIPTGARVVFTETALYLPDKVLPYGDVFYRKSDAIYFHAHHLELIDRCYREVPVKLSPEGLWIGDQEPLDPEQVKFMQAIARDVLLPREAMGLGDVKFIAGIGAFVGWKGSLFTIMGSAMMGSIVGLTAIALKKQSFSSRIPYGPYIALAAVLWIFQGENFLVWWKALAEPDPTFQAPLP